MSPASFVELHLENVIVSLHRSHVGAVAIVVVAVTTATAAAAAVTVVIIDVVLGTEVEVRFPSSLARSRHVGRRSVLVDTSSNGIIGPRTTR